MVRNTGMKRTDPSRQVRRRRLLMGGLAIFLLFDIALVAFALNSTRAPAKPAAHRSVTPTPKATATSTPAPSPKSQPVAAVVPTRILVARDGSLAWRATTGACPAAPASPERTTDGGATWKSTDATAPTGVRSLQTIVIAGKDVASMVGQSPNDCSAMFVRTYVAGDNYEEYSADLSSTWYVNPLNRAVVHSPSGDFAAPCTAVLALATRDAGSAAVLCDDQTIHSTTDAGASWSAALASPGVLNLAPTATGYVAAAVGAPGCAGVEVLSITESAAALQAEPSGCLASDVAPASLSGNVALSQTADTLWLWAGDILARSADGGNTWQ